MAVGADTHKLCGFVINTIDITNRNSSMFFKRIMDGMGAELAANGVDLVIYPGPSGEDMVEYLRRLVGRGHIDGIIIAETQIVDRRIEFLNDAGIPFVTFGKSGTTGSYKWVDIDFPGMVRQSVERFHAKGHRKIAISVPRLDLDLSYANASFAEYKRILAEFELEFRDDYVFILGENTRENGVRIAKSIVALEDPPTAIINLDDAVSAGVIAGLEEHNWVPGRDLGIVGFITEPETDAPKPAISGFWFNVEDVGRTIGRTLIGSMEHARDPENKTVENVIYPMTYLEGASDAFGPRPG